MSDFARVQLEKYGWKEGKGLGKHEHGIATALRPKLKFDNHGVGHNPGKEFTNDWWNLAFNQAAKNITVVNSDDGVLVNSKASRKKKKNHKSSSSRYGSNFVKTATLLSSGEVALEQVDTENAGNEDVISSVEVPHITEEELIAKCGGRTAHKAARHGFKLSGKLLRLQHQEASVLSPSVPHGSELLSASPCDASDLNSHRSKKKRRQKHSTELNESSSKKGKLLEDKTKPTKKVTR